MGTSTVQACCIRAARVLRLALLCLWWPAVAQAQYSYQINGSTCTITGYTGAGGAISIPSNINGFAVAGIGAGAFLEQANLTSVIIPDTVTSIGTSAFMYCSNLVSITIPSSVTYLGSWAFEACSKLSGVTIPPVPSLGQQVFALCSSLTSVTIPGSVTNIGNWAFAPCTNLATIYFQGNAPSMGTGVFNYAAANVTVFYLEGTTGWTNPWYGLPAVPLTPTIPYTFTTNNGAIIITSYTGTNSVVTIPDTINGLPVTSIGGINGDGGFVGAFQYGSVTSVTLPNSVTNLGAKAFFLCGSLTNVAFGTGVTSIGTDAFGGCSGLTSITLPASLTSLSGAAFIGCTGLTGVYFLGNAPGPGTDTSVFQADTLATVYYLPGTLGWGATFDGLPTVPLASVPYTFTTNNGTITITSYTGTNNVVAIPGTINGLPVTSIGGINGDGGFVGAFQYSSVTSVTLPNSVTNLGDKAFFLCGTLTNVAFGTGVTSIGTDAFGGCSGLTSITLPGSLTTIGGGHVSYWGVLGAFENCTSLTSIVIPASVSTIAEAAFQGCSNLTGVYFQGNAPGAGTDTSVFSGDNLASVYYLSGTSGWGALFDGRPTVVSYAPASDFLFVTNGAAITITGYRGAGGVVTIPASINGYGVVSIGFSAFAGKTNLTVSTLV